MRTVATRRTLPLCIIVCRFGGHGAGTSRKAHGGHYGAATGQHRVAAGATAGRRTGGLAGCGHETSLFCMGIVAAHAVVSKHFAAKSPNAGAALPRTRGAARCRCPVEKLPSRGGDMLRDRRCVSSPHRTGREGVCAHSVSGPSSAVRNVRTTCRSSDEASRSGFTPSRASRTRSVARVAPPACVKRHWRTGGASRDVYPRSRPAVTARSGMRRLVCSVSVRSTIFASVIVGGLRRIRRPVRSR